MYFSILCKNVPKCLGEKMISSKDILILIL